MGLPENKGRRCTAGHDVPQDANPDRQTHGSQRETGHGRPLQESEAVRKGSKAAARSSPSQTREVQTGRSRRGATELGSCQKGGSGGRGSSPQENRAHQAQKHCKSARKQETYRNEE